MKVIKGLLFVFFLLSEIGTGSRFVYAMGKRTQKETQQHNQGPIYRGFNLEEISSGLVTCRRIQPFSTLNLDDLDQLRESYLNNHPHPRYEILRDYFIQIFFDETDATPNTVILRDFEGIPGNDGLPKQLSIAEGLAGIDQLIQYAVQGDLDKNKSFVLATRYYFKRVLVFLDENPEKIPQALTILASVGSRCRTERIEGLKLLERMFYGEEKGSSSMASPSGVDQHIGHALDQLREKLFRMAVAFDDPKVEPSHTSLYYRRETFSILGISPEYNDPAHKAQTDKYRLIPVQEFLNRFFEGKKRQHGSHSAEGRRSHPGYTPNIIAKAIIDYAYLHAHDPSPPFSYEQLLDFFSSNISPLEVYAWASSNRRDLIRTYLMDEEMSLREQNEFLDQIPFSHLSMAFINSKYLRPSDLEQGCPLTKGDRVRFSEQGIRKILLLTGHVEKISSQSGHHGS